MHWPPRRLRSRPGKEADSGSLSDLDDIQRCYREEVGFSEVKFVEVTLGDGSGDPLYKRTVLGEGKLDHGMERGMCISYRNCFGS